MGGSSVKENFNPFLHIKSRKPFHTANDRITIQESQSVFCELLLVPTMDTKIKHCCASKEYFQHVINITTIVIICLHICFVNCSPGPTMRYKIEHQIAARNH
uniref:Uncharacterized protein n=1 Tax=Nelumbo nucifera TaxID=4432 RepID=A0A822ZTS6_NELNU|nr:TPA_asm: hypothetical protein HUJ06_018290 [Nelumbo nucifera]